MIIYNPSAADIKLAADNLKAIGVVTGNRYPDVFDGYVSAFGASIAQCGIIATLAAYESDDTEAEYRKLLPAVIGQYLSGRGVITADDAREGLTKTLITRQKDGKVALTRAIENASVAVKVALRMFRGDVSAKPKITVKLPVVKSADFAGVQAVATSRNMGREFQFNNTDITSWHDFSDALALNRGIVDTLRSRGFITLPLKVKAPGLLIGTGLMHGLPGDDNGFKTGMHFDYTSGLPVIPGSSVKGVVRNYFTAFSPGNVDTKRIFDDGSISGSGAIEKDIFADALITGYNPRYGIVASDHITPHPSPIAEPKPLKILKVMPGVEFTFCLRLYDAPDISALDKRDLILRLLTTVGIGAKTRVGYGRLQP